MEMIIVGFGLATMMVGFSVFAALLTGRWWAGALMLIATIILAFAGLM